LTRLGLFLIHLQSKK